MRLIKKRELFCSREKGIFAKNDENSLEHRMKSWLIKKRELFLGNFKEKFPSQRHFFFSLRREFGIPLNLKNICSREFFFVQGNFKKSYFLCYDHNANFVNEKGNTLI